MWKYIRQVKRQPELEKLIVPALSDESSPLNELVDSDEFQLFLDQLNANNFIDSNIIRDLLYKLNDKYNLAKIVTNDDYDVINTDKWLDINNDEHEDGIYIDIYIIIAYIAIVVENAFDPILALYLWNDRRKEYCDDMEESHWPSLIDEMLIVSKNYNKDWIYEIDLPVPSSGSYSEDRDRWLHVIFAADIINTNFKSLDEVYKNNLLSVLGKDDSYDYHTGIKMKIGGKYYTIAELSKMGKDKNLEKLNLKVIPATGDFYRIGEANSHTLCCHRQGYVHDNNKPIKLYYKSNTGMCAADFPVLFQSQKAAEDFINKNKNLGLNKDHVYKARLTSTDKRNGFVEIDTEGGKCLVQEYKINSLFNL